MPASTSVQEFGTLNARLSARFLRDLCETLETLSPEDQPAVSDQQTRSEIAHRRTAEPLLTLKEAADYLRLTPSAMYMQRHRGARSGALGIRVGKKILYRPSDINRFLDEQLAKTHSWQSNKG